MAPAATRLRVACLPEAGEEAEELQCTPSAADSDTTSERWETATPPAACSSRRKRSAEGRASEESDEWDMEDDEAEEDQSPVEPQRKRLCVLRQLPLRRWL